MSSPETRVSIDNQVSNLLFLANGGGIITLLALLKGTITDPKMDCLTVFVMIGLAVLIVGVFTTIKYTQHRRECSLEHSQHPGTARESKPCKKEERWRKVSFWTFLIAGFIVLIGGATFIIWFRGC